MPLAPGQNAAGEASGSGKLFPESIKNLIKMETCIMSIFAPPGATFQINVRPPLRLVSGMSGVSAKIAKSSMFETMFRAGSSRPQCSPPVSE